MGDQQSFPINRRTFLAMGLVVPFGALPVCRQPDSLGLYPISMDRCVVFTKGCLTPRRFDSPEVPEGWAYSACEPRSSTWHCEIAHAAGLHLVQDWWLIISQTENRQSHLTVIQPPSAVQTNAGLLAARITFRLHVLQRRGLAQGFSNRQLVAEVNHQILQAMKNMPA